MKLIYLAKVSDGLNLMSGVVFFMFVFLFIFTFIGYLLNDKGSDDEQKCWRGIKDCMIGMFVFGLITVFLPTKREFYEMYGIGKTIDYIESNEQAKQLPDKVVNILDAWLDDYLKDGNKKSE